MFFASRIVFTMLLLLISMVAVANDEVREVSGFGVTRNEAVVNALLEALQQTQGANLQGTETLRSQLSELSVSTNDESVDIQSMSAQQQGLVQKTTGGRIKSYSILNLRPASAGSGWEALLEVVIPVYETPGFSPHSLRKIAVMPARTRFVDTLLINRRFSGDEVARQYGHKLVNQLTQSRRFSVMDRDYMDEYLKERNLLLSDNASQDELMKVGQALGVDYLLLGTITEFKAETTTTYSSTLGQGIPRSRIQFNADFRIMVMATRQVKWADTVKISLDQKQIAAFVKNNDDQGLLDTVLEQAAEEVVHSSLDNIYPVKVLKVAGKQAIYLNQGGKMTQVGERFDIYTPGETIPDPDTGLPIHIDGEKTATVEVTRVQAKYSLAKLINGDIGEVQAGAILRRSEAKTMDKPYRQKVMDPAW